MTSMNRRAFTARLASALATPLALIGWRKATRPNFFEPQDVEVGAMPEHWKSFKPTPEDLEFLKVQSEAVHAVCRAYQIPKGLLQS